MHYTETHDLSHLDSNFWKTMQSILIIFVENKEFTTLAHKPLALDFNVQLLSHLVYNNNNNIN
jgi:hypothetical protein